MFANKYLGVDRTACSLPVITPADYLSILAAVNRAPSVSTRVALYAKMLMSSNHDAGRGSVIIPIVTTMGANPQSRAVRVFWKIKSMSKRRSPMAGSDARLRTPEEFLLRGTGMIYFGPCEEAAFSLR